jgi:hypothetical protein
MLGIRHGYLYVVEHINDRRRSFDPADTSLLGPEWEFPRSILVRDVRARLEQIFAYYGRVRSSSDAVSAAAAITLVTDGGFYHDLRLY